MKAYISQITVKSISKVDLHRGVIEQRVYRAIDEKKNDYYIPLSADVVIDTCYEVKYFILHRYNAGAMRMVSAIKKLAIDAVNVKL
jgi:hypothetical protein